jgi:hypothetical protein
MHALISLFFIACAPEPEQEPDLTTPVEDDLGAAWTILVYMDGDNDLESYVMHDLNELEASMLGPDVRVLVLADRAEGYVKEDGDWTTTRRYEILPDADLDVVVSPVIEDMGELDMADPQTLADFITWGRSYAPAERTAIVLWNHGTTWWAEDPEGDGPAHGPGEGSLLDPVTGDPPGTTPPPGVAWDDSSGRELSIAKGELQEGLAMGIGDGAPFDVIAFDACNMASFEVAHALAPYGLTLVGAESTVGMEGLNYTSTVGELSLNPGVDGVVLADLFARHGVKVNMEPNYSAIGLDDLDPLVTAIDNIAGLALEDEAAMDAFLAGREAARGAESDPWRLAYLDLGDLGSRLSEVNHPAMAEAGAALESAVFETVIAAYGSRGFVWTTGMTIYADTVQTDLRDYTKAGASWSEVTRWDELLKTIAAAE